ncbi:unnamed protein product [Candida verbasci]|uniref:Lysophospholipase n=1 Tax=Candida verbasci TaxID=1227364 RepID=A0A9W4TT97_9ASCO|nr:unnamed protein product [Candida verbasci]
MRITGLLAIVAYFSPIICWSPTDSYAPGRIDCPDDGNFLRVAKGLSDEEKEWVEGRNQVTDQALIEFLRHANMTNFDAENFINGLNDSIKIGLAYSGGGYRAGTCALGQLAAIDNRTDGAWEHGLGGLLQASTYMVGLSGGNWMVGSIALNNFTSTQRIIDKNDIWDLTHSIMNVGGWNVVQTYKYYKGISDDIDKKRDAGYEVSITDTWGRALSYQFFSTLNDTGAALTWSTLQDADVFKNHEMPFPIVVADGRAPSTKIISGNSTIYEFNPFEMGSWDPSLYQFMKIKYLGTDLEDGENNGTCIGGFDNAGYIMGTSSSLFNQFILQINTTSISSTIKSILTSILQNLSEEENDVAVYEPNPFYDSQVGYSENTIQNKSLNLVDGGEDGQNIPLYPLLQQDRSVDVIFAYDNSADTDSNWPNGTSMVQSFKRQFDVQGNSTHFPYVPDQKTFMNLNLTARPAFFGCDAKNLSSLVYSNQSSDFIYDIPLIVYTANRPFSYWSNTSTFKMKYSTNERNSMFRNGFEVASRYNLTLDTEWNACVGCAIIRRQQERQGIEQSDQCKQCFERYCWDGTLDTADIKVNYTDNGTTNSTETLVGDKSSDATTLLMNWSIWCLLGISFFVLH